MEAAKPDPPPEAEVGDLEAAVVVGLDAPDATTRPPSPKVEAATVVGTDALDAATRPTLPKATRPVEVTAVEAAEAPAEKRRRYCIEPDVLIEVEGEVFPVHSQVVMLASPVFCRMLSHDMREAREGRIVLHGKTKEEFRQVLPFLTSVGFFTRSEPHIDVENVPVLLRWGSEYEIAGLQQACEQVLVTQDAASPEALKMAVEFGLPERAVQCAEAIGRDILSHWDKLREFADEDAVMGPIWPYIFKAAGVSSPANEPIIGRPLIKSLWPLIEKAMFSLPVRSKKEVIVGMRVRVIDDLEGLRASCRSRLGWQDQMQTCVGQVGVVVEKDEDDDINVKFREGGTWFIPHTALLRSCAPPLASAAVPSSRGPPRVGAGANAVTV